MKNHKKYTLTTINIFLFTFLLFQVNCSNNKIPQTSSLRTVRLTTPETKNNMGELSYWGIIEEGKNVNASFMADGKINRILVKEGDRVRKGQFLASLDDSDYQIGVNQLKAQFNQMSEEKKRMDEMFARHNIAPNDYEKFSTGYEQLKLQLQMAENKLSYTNLYSPSDGYVSEKYMEPGELVGAGTPIFKIIDDSSLLTNVDIPVNFFLNRKNIISVEGYSPLFPDETIPLMIESFTPDPSNNMIYRMKLMISQPYTQRFTSGMNLKVKIITDGNNNDGILVQSRSIFDENGKKYVWIYNPNDSSIYKKEIFISGLPSGNKMNVSGLAGNELIVETGVKQLFEGEKVIISNNSDYGL